MHIKFGVLYFIQKLTKPIIIAAFFLYLWMIIITIKPIEPKRLVATYTLGDINNLSSWKEIQGPSDFILNIKSRVDADKNYIEFNYQKPPINVFLISQKNIPVSTLYEAKTITLTVYSEQNTNLSVNLSKKGTGPGWGPVKLSPNKDHKPQTFYFPLDDPEYKLFNWLPGDYDAVGFTFTDFDINKPLDVKFYEVYLK